MITINLLPVAMRKAERKRVALPANFPYKIYLVGIAAVLVCMHFLLFSLMIVKKIQTVSLRNSWSKIEPESKQTSSVKKEIKDLEAESAQIKTNIAREFSMTELLSSLSAAIPNGLWLESFSFGDKGMVVQGSVVSLQQNEMTLIGKFLQDLKNNKVFSKVFSKIDLSSVQRRTIKTYDVVDFILIGEIKK
ncbi:MAG TPA: PilN domain-containing protein [Candidatus Omnitrophota bacterium]|nr:PilN domain-containing protein [Candidatus Omnitrophota bacterium]